MARELYTLLTGLGNTFRVPMDPGPVADYTRPVLLGQQPDVSPLLRTEQATVDTQFSRQKHYFLSWQNIEHACFTALDVSINDAFKVSSDPLIWGWHAGMSVCKILDQLSSIYGQPTPAAMELINTAFAVFIRPPMLLKYCFVTLRIVRRLPSLAVICTPIANSCRM
jgi:hypothetical protein